MVKHYKSHTFPLGTFTALAKDRVCKGRNDLELARAEEAMPPFKYLDKRARYMSTASEFVEL